MGENGIFHLIHCDLYLGGGRLFENAVEQDPDDVPGDVTGYEDKKQFHAFKNLAFFKAR
jgi:hypothetical protein